MMNKERTKEEANEPFTEYGHYSYADYLTWELEEMVELIKGKVFKAAAAPRRVHQKISGKIFTKIHNYLENAQCEVYIAPFDVRLPHTSKNNEDVFTVVQPDICVVCDKGKLDEMGCIGAPDLIVEVLSQGNNKKELKNKYEVYEDSGVKEYWIFHPSEQTMLIYSLIHKKFVPSKLLTVGDRVASECIPGFQLDLDDVFKDLD